MELKSRNFLLFRTAQATVASHGQQVKVKGLRFPFMKGRYSILIENVWYGDTPLPKETREAIEAVRQSLQDPHEAPKKVPIKQTPG